MAFCGQDEQTACIFDRLFIRFVSFFDLRTNFVWVFVWVCGDSVHDFEFDIAAQFDISTAACHIGRDCNGTQFARIRNNLRFLFVLTGI